MVYAITSYFHSGKQRLWIGKGALEPACWRQVGLGVLFLLGRPAGEPVLQRIGNTKPLFTSSPGLEGQQS